jgi:hypothetical protein
MEVPMTQASPGLSPDASAEQIAGRLNQLLRENHERRTNGQGAPPQAAKPKPREPGVYFGLPAAEYHADPAIGSSDIKRLLQAPAVYWFHSHLNPARPVDKDTPAKLKGRALHTLVLEGEQAFAKAFAEAPTPREGDLVTAEELKAMCRQLVEPVSGTKAELAKRIRDKLPPGVRIFDDTLREFQERIDRERLATLSRDQMAEVRAAVGAIGCNPHLARAFTGGVSEVSVFWEEDGVRLKARFDYLKPRTVVDLKGFANQRERPADVAIRLAIAEYRYDVQASHYLDAYSALFELAALGRIFGNCPLNRGWHKRIV